MPLMRTVRTTYGNAEVGGTVNGSEILEVVASKDDQFIMLVLQGDDCLQTLTAPRYRPLPGYVGPRPVEHVVKRAHANGGDDLVLQAHENGCVTVTIKNTCTRVDRGELLRVALSVPAGERADHFKFTEERTGASATLYRDEGDPESVQLVTQQGLFTFKISHLLDALQVLAD